MWLALKRPNGEMTFNSPSDSVINGGDCLIALGTDDQLKKLEILAGSG